MENPLKLDTLSIKQLKKLSKQITELIKIKEQKIAIKEVYNEFCDSNLLNIQDISQVNKIKNLTSFEIIEESFENNEYSHETFFMEVVVGNIIFMFNYEYDAEDDQGNTGVSRSTVTIKGVEYKSSWEGGFLQINLSSKKFKEKKTELEFIKSKINFDPKLVYKWAISIVKYHDINGFFVFDDFWNENIYPI